MRNFLWGSLAMACWVAGLFFLRFFRDTRDRLFLLFGLGFWALCANWIALALVNPSDESRHWFFLLRMVAFLLISAGVVEKNLQKKRIE
jgi:hypothetical protein